MSLGFVPVALAFCAACHLLFLASAKVSAALIPSYRSFDRSKYQGLWRAPA
jgi:hypothetical protein